MDLISQAQVAYAPILPASSSQTNPIFRVDFPVCEFAAPVAMHNAHTLSPTFGRERKMLHCPLPALHMNYRLCLLLASQFADSPARRKGISRISDMDNPSQGDPDD